MAQEKRITKDFIIDLSAKTKFSEQLLTKDYYLTQTLYLLREIEGIYFKGGTALQKTILDYARISEDLDFTLIADVTKKDLEIKEILQKQWFVKRITNDKSVDKFTRIVIYFDTFSGKEDFLFIDLNQRGGLLTPPVKQKMNHYYPDIPKFSINTISTEEMIAEKVAAAIGRNKPRDHFDIYQIIKKGYPINLLLVKKKCEQSGDEFSIIKMFNQAKKLHKRWNEDLAPLLVDEVSYEEVMQTLAKYFGLQKAKDVVKQNKNL